MIVSCKNIINFYIRAVMGLIMVCSMVSTAMAMEEVPRDPRQYFFIQSFGDLPEELEAAKVEGKQGILLFFEAEDCKYCQAMLKGVLSDRKVQNFYRENFLSIAVDIHGDVEIRDFDGIILPSKVFASHRQVFITPVLSFLDLEGREIYRHLGMVKTPQALLSIGDYIIGKHYLDTEYEVFAKRKETEQEKVTEHVNRE
jgi:thioredoxin-related protein